ncbi:MULTISPECIES: 3-hydroxyacyl-CoA dehydrogenase/enoyl-CoA hydratase family protein [unclassified Spirosoma]|uniref:3-hydroxyacyl-CoA dehydrogenase/enoyl-CoA hydratase family protein n=1 Tax=unclassified Spirosoma TaxID=2621999 RepID=UPI0009637BAC|nr:MULTISPECIES: 3-hydroxyacyl-CoA dehydrogenase/enoyl-CoA hydratase family protein [unclassified Spirosoma]MBN8821654.1 3-hydroxyacyl-CoA dehydrogenase/enoyl-CoA hydratase family protein [Spirosoma sp.]OJW80849.1 MAG: 3-hydroxyacyl-CoA dehydrogenase [Spirosoma sp. 48-14]
METTLEKTKSEGRSLQTKNRTIRRVAVLGSGIMGSRIAAHFANIGVDVLLLDIVPKEPSEAEQAKGLTTASPAVRNRIVNDSFQAMLKASPASLYSPKFADRIKLGNFDDNLKEIGAYDWVIEVVVERLDIKRSVYGRVEQFRKPGTLITSNTSGIPMQLLAEGRSEDFRRNFCGTHFFNPPRYLRLLEIIPGPDTDPAVVDFLMNYGDLYLGKTTVLCKDTPGFIANRLGIQSLIQTIRVAEELGLSVEEVDKLTGPVVGRPKSGTFRLSDVVGLDTTVNVASNLVKMEHDESRASFELPASVKKLMENKWLGDKTGQGYYKKTKDEKGQTLILALDLKTFEYKPSEKVKFATLESTKAIDNLKNRFPVLIAGKDKAGEFYRRTFADGFRYATYRIPEISDELYRIDAAITAGFGWQMGLFETWDAIGVKKGVELIESFGQKPAQWVYDMLDAGFDQFYKVENGKRKYYDIPTKSYKVIPGTEAFTILENLSNNIVWKNAGANIVDLGDGILNVEFRSKMNTFGQEVSEALNKGISLAEKDFRGLVVGNDSTEAFSAGANLATLFMFAVEQEFDEVNLMIAQFQKLITRLRYSSIPVVVAPHTLTLGGGCEAVLHADRVVAHAESYIGLVEVGVGLIPAGGGTKEMAARASDLYQTGDPELNIVQNVFMNIATAKVSTSAQEAREMNYLRSTDQIVLNRSRLLAEAKQAAIELAENGYTQPKPRTDIKVQGKTGIALFKAGITAMHMGRYISDHDRKIADKLAYVICGGDLSTPQTVSEQYLLDLEREAFLSLTGEKKTLERIQSLLTGGKALRN